jgi:PBP1b-binding outer membrane lipoprotein LpoB
MNTVKLSVIVLSAMAMAGCATEQTRRIVDGEDTEVTSGFAEADLRIVVDKAVEGINAASMRYARQDARRIVNVKPFTVDTTARGSQAGYLADSLKMMFEEALMGWDGPGGSFIVYNEEFAAQTGYAATRPEFIMTGKLREQNVRRDNGNFYKETSLLIKLTDVATGLDFWQKRVPIQKAVDKKNVMK